MPPTGPPSKPAPSRLREPVDQFYGDRSAQVRDPLGNVWFIATAKENVPEDEQMKRWDEISKEQQKV